MGSLRLITRLASMLFAAILAVPVTYAANVCDPVTGTNCVEVNAAANGGGAHTSEYDLRDQFTGQKRTYTATTAASFTAANGTGAFLSICGSGTQTLRIQRLNINGTGTALVRGNVTLRKTSTATSGGTATALVQVPHDSSSAAGTASLVNVYTVAPTAGTLVGTVGSRLRTFPLAVGASDFIPEMLWEFVGRESEAIVLRGTGECLEAGYSANPGNTTPLFLSVTWTEE